jgi:hypothetical protein
MSGAIPPLLQYAFMGWCSVEVQGQLYLFTSFENVKKFKISGNDILTDQNYIHEEIKATLNSGNGCYHSVQSLLFFRLFSINLGIKIYKTTIILAVLYGCETWSLLKREKYTEGAKGIILT